MTDQNVGSSAQPPTVRTVENSATSAELRRATGNLETLRLNFLCGGETVIPQDSAKVLAQEIRLVLDALEQLQGWADADKRFEAKVRADERRKVGEELLALVDEVKTIIHPSEVRRICRRSVNDD